jgi:hypothetical protein
MIIEKGITPALVAATAMAIYTLDSNLKKAIIKKLTFYNSDTVAQTLTVYLVTAGGSPTAAQTLIGARSLAAGETFDCQEAVNQVLAAGGMIQCLASTASKIGVLGSVLEHSY